MQAGFQPEAVSSTADEGGYGSGQIHDFYPGGDVNNPTADDDMWSTDYLAGPNGMRFLTWTNSPVRPYLSLSNIGADDLRIQITDNALAKDSYLAIDYFTLEPVYGIEKTGQVEAEDCNLYEGGGAYPDANVHWYVNGPWVNMATDANNNNINASGEVLFNIPEAIPDGNYILTMGYAIGSWDANEGSSAAYKIALASGASGTVIENDVNTQNDWHTFYPTGYCPYQIDELAGPNGFGFSVDANTPVGSSLTLEGISADELVIHVWDKSVGTYDHLRIDYFKFEPIE
ncbi:MAG: hypothetical protein ABIG61_11470 [Planctomycetota bacterium]